MCPYYALFLYCTPYLAKSFQSAEIISLLNFYDNKHVITALTRGGLTQFKVNISEKILPLRLFFNLIVTYQENHTLSSELTEHLQNLKKTPILDNIGFSSQPNQ